MWFRLLVCAALLLLAVMTIVGEGRMAIGLLLIFVALGLPALDTTRRFPPRRVQRRLRPGVRQVRQRARREPSVHRTFVPLNAIGS